MESYQNFDLELTDYRREEDGGEHFRVRVTASPVGEQRAAEAEEVQLPADLRLQARRLEGRRLDLPALIRLGWQLAGALLPASPRRLLERSLERLGEGEGLRLRLRLDAPELAELPWEYAYLPLPDTPPGELDPRGFVGLRGELSLVRYEQLEAPVGRLKPAGDAALRLVALLADPPQPGIEPLDLAKEAAGIEAALAELPGVAAEVAIQATVEDLGRALDRPAHIFHFAGHGHFELEMGEALGTIEGKGSLLFEGKDRAVVKVPAATLALNLARQGVRLAVLSACEGARRDAVNEWSGIAPVLVHQGLPAVVAMQATIRDESAIAFSQRFYEVLADGRPIDAAVSAGRLAIFNAAGAEERDWGTPVLYLRAVDGVLFPQRDAGRAGEPLPRRFWVNAGLSAGSLALAALYFTLHLAPLIPAGLAVGGLSLAAVAGLLLGWLRYLADEEMKAALRRSFFRRKATAGLAAALATLTLLALGTSSLHLPYEPPERPAPPVEVRIESPRLGLDESVRLGAGRQSWSRLWLGRVSRAPVTFTLLGSPLVEPRSRTLPWGWSVRQAVPGDFFEKELTALLLLPFKQLVGKLPRESPSDCRLELAGAGGEVLLQREMLRQALFVGAAPELVTALRAKAPLEPALEQELIRRELPEGSRRSLIEGWLRSEAFTAEPIVPGAEELQLAVRCGGEEVFCARRRAADLAGGKIKVWILDPAESGC